MLVVDDTLKLELAEGVIDVVCGTDGGEYLMEDTACLDKVTVLFVVFILSCYKVVTTVTLPEGDLTFLMAEIDSQRF